MDKNIINTAVAPAPVGPYSQAVLAGNTLYVSGQIGIEAHTGKMVEGDIAAETTQVMNNLGAVLRAAGMDYSHLVKCSIFVTDINDFPAVNVAYEKYFENKPPARETVGVAALPKGARVEISCIAVS